MNVDVVAICTAVSEAGFERIGFTDAT